MICIIPTIFTELYKQRLQDSSLEKEWATPDLLLSQETPLLVMDNMLKTGLEIMLLLLSNLNIRLVRSNPSACLEFLSLESMCADSLTTQTQSSAPDGHNSEQCILSSETTTLLESQNKNSTYSPNTRKESKRASLKDTH